MYSVNSTENSKKVFLSLHCNGANSYLFVNGTGIVKLKEKDSEILQLHYVQETLCLRLFSRYHEKYYIKWIFYDFSVNYDATVVDAILDIRKYLMKKIKMI